MFRKKAAEIVVHNFASAAAGYFGSIRIPATLITGTSLGFLFAFTDVDIDSKSAAEVLVLRGYHFCVLFAFGNALTTVIISTSAYVSMLHGRFNPYATTAYEMMRREFDFEFSITRFCFLVSLFSFIGAVTFRIILEFALLKRERRMHLCALLAFMTSITTNLLSYINRTMYCWHSLFGLTVHVLRLSFQSLLLAREERYPLLIISFLSGIVALILMVKVMFFGGRAASSRAVKAEKND